MVNSPDTRVILSQQIADEIVRLINDQKYTPGDRLPSEYELAEQLHVARGTVREAVKALVSRNILEIRRGKGTFVTQNPGFTEDPWGLEFFRDKFDVAMQLLELRKIIEPDLVALACQRATPEEVASIFLHCRETEAAIRAGLPHNTQDMGFHLAIAHATHNTLAENMLRQLYVQSVELQIKLSRNQLLAETISTHASIAQAIAEKDIDTGCTAMIAHIECNINALEHRHANQDKG